MFLSININLKRKSLYNLEGFFYGDLVLNQNF
jgi:hypothetical protein